MSQHMFSTQRNHVVGPPNNCSKKNFASMASSAMKQFATPNMASMMMLLLAFSSVSAERDSDYWIPNYKNPNLKHAMYWKDSVNVLQDLDLFESLYITYHHWYVVVVLFFKPSFFCFAMCYVDRSRGSSSFHEQKR